MAFWRDDGYPAPGQVSEKTRAEIRDSFERMSSGMTEAMDRMIGEAFDLPGESVFESVRRDIERMMAADPVFGIPPRVSIKEALAKLQAEPRIPEPGWWAK